VRHAALRITAFCGAPQIGADAALPSYVSTRTSYDAFAIGQIVLPGSNQIQDAFFIKNLDPVPIMIYCVWVGLVNHRQKAAQ
jgi:hypothetical protein